MRKRAGVIFINPLLNEVLLIKRVKANHIYYVIPGGGVKEHETYSDAAHREIKEELNSDIDEIFECFHFSHEKYYYAFMEEKRNFKICGEEMQRQSKNNLYIPMWVKIANLNTIPLYPKEIISVIQSKF